MKKIFIIILYFYQINMDINSNKKNLILGAIKNYNWEQLKPFFISLHKANFKNYDCVMFVDNLSQNTYDKLKSIGVKLYKFPKKYRGVKVNHLRYKLYKEYLVDKIDNYNIILHVDVRDTFFQEDLFQIYKNKKDFIGLAYEDGNISQATNAIWMKGQYGKQIYEELKDKRIICSGTIWGTSKKFYELIKNIWDEIKTLSYYNLNIHDQTTTNYLIYHKKIFNNCLIFSDNNYGPVMTTDISKNRNFSFDSENNLLNFIDKKKVAIVHQYDRITKLKTIVRDKYTFQSEQNFKIDFIENKNDMIIKNLKNIIIILGFIFLLIIKLKSKY